jgi:hypothetical protein
VFRNRGGATVTDVTLLDWSLLAKIFGVMAVGGTCVGVGVKIIVFFTRLNTSVETLTTLAIELKGEAKKIGEQYNTLDKRMIVVEKLLDLDDIAQSMIRDRQHVREERRARLRRDHDRVSEEIRDVIQHEMEKDI